MFALKSFYTPMFKWCLPSVTSDNIRIRSNLQAGSNSHASYFMPLHYTVQNSMFNGLSYPLFQAYVLFIPWELAFPRYGICVNTRPCLQNSFLVLHNMSVISPDGGEETFPSSSKNPFFGQIWSNPGLWSAQPMRKTENWSSRGIITMWPLNSLLCDLVSMAVFLLGHFRKRGKRQYPPVKFWRVTSFFSALLFSALWSCMKAFFEVVFK